MVDNIVQSKRSEQNLLAKVVHACVLNDVWEADVEGPTYGREAHHSIISITSDTVDE